MNGHQPPNRLKYAVILALGFGVSQVTGAVGLGPIIGVNSHLGQPLNASIRVDGLSKEQAQKASVTLASAAEYRSRGIQRLPSHDQLRFKIVPAGNGYRIHVSSKNGIREPFVNFLLTISSNGEKITREYALFLNPDPAGNIVPSAPAMPEPAETPAVVAEAKPVPVVPQSAAVTAPPVAAPKKDDGFIGQARPSQGGIIPASEEAEGWGVVSPGAQRVVLSAQNSTVAPAGSMAGAGSGGSGTYGPVKAGETLYSIAAATKPASMSVNEMMHAIKRANPRAFSSSSMNSLMAGVTLVIPHGGGSAAAPVLAAAAPVTESVAEAPAEKPRSRRSSRRKQQHETAAQPPVQQAAVETAPPADTAMAETPASMEEGNVPMAMTAQTEAAPTETAQAASEMPVGEAPAEQASAGTENATPAPGMDTSLSLEGVDSVQEGSATAEAPSGEMSAADMPAGSMAGSEPVASETASVETQPATATTETVAATPPETAPVETPPAVSQPVQAPVVQPAPAPAAQDNASPLPFGLQIWHLAVAAGALLIGLLLAILMKARGRKRDIDDIEDMSPAEIDRMVAELENDESLQRSFHDDLDNLDDLSYEQLSREKATMDDHEQEIMKARLAELAELEALEKEADDDFDTLAQQAERLPAFHPETDAHEEMPSFFDDVDAADSKEAVADASPAVVADEKEESFDWDFSHEEPTVQTSAHEENADDFFSVDEPWAEVAEKAEAPPAVAEPAAPEEDRFDFDVESAKPVAKGPQIRIVPVETAAEVSPEKVEAMEINLDLATSFIATGNAQRAKIWLDEVMLEGSAAQKALAAQLLKKIEGQK